MGLACWISDGAINSPCQTPPFHTMSLLQRFYSAGNNAGCMDVLSSVFSKSSFLDVDNQLRLLSSRTVVHNSRHERLMHSSKNGFLQFPRLNRHLAEWYSMVY